MRIKLDVKMWFIALSVIGLFGYTYYQRQYFSRGEVIYFGDGQDLVMSGNFTRSIRCKISDRTEWIKKALFDTGKTDIVLKTLEELEEVPDRIMFVTEKGTILMEIVRNEKGNVMVVKV